MSMDGGCVWSEEPKERKYIAGTEKPVLVWALQCFGSWLGQLRSYRVLQNLCNKKFAKLNHFQIYCTKMYIVYGLVWLVWSVLPLTG